MSNSLVADAVCRVNICLWYSRSNFLEPTQACTDVQWFCQCNPTNTLFSLPSSKELNLNLQIPSLSTLKHCTKLYKFCCRYWRGSTFGDLSVIVFVIVTLLLGSIWLTGYQMVNLINVLMQFDATKCHVLKSCDPCATLSHTETVFWHISAKLFNHCSSLAVITRICLFFFYKCKKISCPFSLSALACLLHYKSSC